MVDSALVAGDYSRQVYQRLEAEHIANLRKALPKADSQIRRACHNHQTFFLDFQAIVQALENRRVLEACSTMAASVT